LLCSTTHKHTLTLHTEFAGKAKRRHLNAEECSELVRRPEGSGALTQPQTLRCQQGKHDPNRGLYPRTPTKRRKHSRHSKGAQKGITSFFSVTGVVSSSPLLATPLKQDPEEEEEEEEEVDYLEGITAEMFGDDEEFDRCDGVSSSREHTRPEEEEEEEVEALPDAHFGLLGSSSRLQEPQGCMDDLPEEVLRQLLSLLPAQDLYRNAARVCHRWRDVVTDPKFLPLKKQYFRYVMAEENTVREINSLLTNSSVLDSTNVMAQHKLGERVRPEDVLRCVKKHRLFPQAESCLRLRIPDGPNPYAAMAVILILSEGVGDVQALVSLLSGCLSHTAVTEYLSHMATMLLAMMRNGVRISNRVHYNIFYVLHLMENVPPSVGCDHNGRPQVHVTHEQQQILSHDIEPDQVVKIMAFAGTGKTTTLVKYAEQRPHLRFLYVAFNKSVAVQAQRCFPSNVACKTVHSLAFNDEGRRYHIRRKLASGLRPFSISWVLPKGRGGFIHAKVITTTLNAFMASADRSISEHHVPYNRKNNKGKMEPISGEYATEAWRIWSKMKDPNETREQAYHMTHDGYLKLWQLRTPRPCLSDQYDVIFIDEAQDCTPAIMDVLLSQHCGKILVGDPHQQIYTFRGAVNALRIVQHTHLYYLTQSFRFGPEIAYVGATLLAVCKNVQKILVGGNQAGSVYGESEETMATARSGVSRAPGKTAILSRCNATVFSEAVRLTDANPNCRIHFVGGLANAGLDKIMDIWLLRSGGRPGKSIRDAFIRRFLKSSLDGYLGLKRYAEQTEDRELETKLAVVEKYNGRIPELVARLQSCYEGNYHDADFILGTVHKAKGLEFHTVMITDDFVKIPCARHDLHRVSGFRWDEVPEDEWNLLYVAVTRAKTSLAMTRNISYFLTLAGEYFLTSATTGSLLKEGLPPRCSTAGCPNSISADSAFTMCKRPMRYTDGVRSAGPLCERCVWKRVGPTAFLMTDHLQRRSEPPEPLGLPVHHDLLMLLF
uniref:DNA 3'-5' helicase n=1 Tax=Myripristis murdjan TaxID=586833 RepID=A0A667XDH5_9TELE